MDWVAQIEMPSTYAVHMTYTWHTHVVHNMKSTPQKFNRLNIMTLHHNFNNITINNSLYTVCSIQYAVYSTQYTVHSIQYAVYSTQYTVYNMQYTVCTLNSNSVIWLQLLTFGWFGRSYKSFRWTTEHVSLPHCHANPYRDVILYIHWEISDGVIDISWIIFY